MNLNCDSQNDKSIINIINNNNHNKPSNNNNNINNNNILCSTNDRNYVLNNKLNNVGNNFINRENSSSDGDDENRSICWDIPNFVQRVPSSLNSSASPSSGSSGAPSTMNSLDCWDYRIELECLQGPQDLQLAAELGKTLLERNKELENTLKHHQNTVEDQAQEIVYLQKQTVALREVNDSRLKIYEQLEIGIQDLERANHRLSVENSVDKKHIKTLLHNIENLEARTEELTKNLDEVKKELTFERRKNERLQQEKNKANDVQNVRLRQRQDDEPESNESQIAEVFEQNTTAPESCSFVFQSRSSNANSTPIDLNGFVNSQDISSTEDTEEFVRVVCDLETTKKALTSEKQKVAELEEQLVAIIQENQKLQGCLAHTSTNDEMKSVHDELSILDEVRQGQMCTRCLRFVDDRFTMNDDASSIAQTEEDDDRSLMELENHISGDNNPPSSSIYQPAVTIKDLPRAPDSLELNLPASPNLYRDLVEKYEALLKVQRLPTVHKTGMSLAEEFQSSGEYNSLNMKEQTKLQIDNGAQSNDGGSSCNGSMTNENVGQMGNIKNNRRTPTDFSEAETSSSGFSDETSNKGTQTDDRPGFFLCSIGDGEDCKFSIYDDASPIDSRFRNRPEYRELFKEIFAVLRKAAENKEEGEKLPLLDDTHEVVANKVPPVTPANEELPDFGGDDTQSIISSAISEQSFAMSECITKTERKTAKKHITEKNQENKPPAAVPAKSVVTPSVQLPTTNEKQIIENGRVLTPLKREPLEYLSVCVGIKKKNRKKNRNFSNDRSDSPILPSPPRIYYSNSKKGRRSDMRPFNAFTSPSSPSSPLTGTTPKTTSQPKYEWNGTSMIIYNRNTPDHSSREMNTNGMEYRRVSTVSQDLHKLKKLDLSYSEVLRRADVTCKHGHSHPRKH